MPTLTDKMLMFMRMHKYHVVEKTEALFQESMLRVSALAGNGKSITCTLAAHELNELVSLGHMVAVGNAMQLTDKGNNRI